MRKLSTLLTIVLSLSILAGCSSTNYRLIEKDGNYYIQLSERYVRNTASEDSSSASIIRTPVEFSSLSEMKADIQSGNFSDEELKIISGFSKTSDGRIRICNINKLYTPECPADWSIISVYWYGGGYTFTLSRNDEGPAHYQLTDQSSYDRAYNYMYHREEYTDATLDAKTISDDNLTVTYDFTRSDGTQYRKIYRKLIVGGKEMIIEEYPADGLIDVFIYGKENDRFFYSSIIGLSTPLTTDQLSQFGIREYVETVTE